MFDRALGCVLNWLEFKGLRHGVRVDLCGIHKVVDSSVKRIANLVPQLPLSISRVHLARLSDRNFTQGLLVLVEPPLMVWTAAWRCDQVHSSNVAIMLPHDEACVENQTAKVDPQDTFDLKRE